MRRGRLVAITLVVALALVAAIALGARRVWSARADTSLHAEHAMAIAISADGTRVVTGDPLGAIKLWDARDCRPIAARCVRTFGARVAPVSALAFFPDGARVLEGNDDGSVRVWDVDTGALVRTIEHEGRVLSLDVAPDGQRAVVAVGGNIRLYDARDGRQLGAAMRPRLHHVVRFSPDGALVADASEHGLSLLDGATLALVRELESHKAHHQPAPISVAFSADGTRVAFLVRREPCARIVDAESGRLVAERSFGRERFACFVAFVGARVVIGDSQARLHLWDPESGALEQIDAYGDSCGDSQFASDGRAVVATFSSGDGARLGPIDGTVRRFVIPPSGSR